VEESDPKPWTAIVLVAAFWVSFIIFFISKIKRESNALGGKASIGLEKEFWRFIKVFSYVWLGVGFVPFWIYMFDMRVTPLHVFIFYFSPPLALGAVLWSLIRIQRRLQCTTWFSNMLGLQRRRSILLSPFGDKEKRPSIGKRFSRSWWVLTIVWWIGGLVVFYINLNEGIEVITLTAIFGILPPFVVAGLWEIAIWAKARKERQRED
jgi:hypothetical protein